MSMGDEGGAPPAILEETREDPTRFRPIRSSATSENLSFRPTRFRSAVPQRDAVGTGRVEGLWGD